MERSERQRLGREHWIDAALAVLQERGVGGEKVTLLAKRLGVTRGSFYWNFGKLQDLLDATLEHWENRLTEHVADQALASSGRPEERIFRLMEQVIETDAAGPDHAIAVWGKSDPDVREVYERTIQRWFDLAAWKFGKAGFDPEEAAARRRLIVACLMGEATTCLMRDLGWREVLRRQFGVLIVKS